MAKNKPVNLNIGQFMNQVKENQPAEKKELTPENPEPLAEENSDINTEQPEESSTSHAAEKKPTETKDERRGKGRPAKKTLRSERVIFKLDKDSMTNLALIKALNKTDIQDVVFTAMVDFLDKHFSRNKGLDNEGMEIVRKIKEKYDC